MLRLLSIVTSAWLVATLFGEAVAVGNGAELQHLYRGVDVRSLPYQAAGLRIPVELEGVVTFHDTNRNRLFVEDATAGVLVEPSLPANGHLVGRQVRVEGVTAELDDHAFVSHAAIFVLGTGKFPVPAVQNLRRLLTDHGQHQWVSVEATLCRVTSRGGMLTLGLGDRGQRISCELYASDPEPLKVLIGGRVRVDAVCARDNYSSEPVGPARLYIPGPEHLTLLRAPRARETIPLEPLGTVAGLQREDRGERRRRVRGQVTLCMPGRYVALQDGTDSLFVGLAPEVAARPGDTVEAIGFASSVGGLRTVLSDAVLYPVEPPLRATPGRFTPGTDDLAAHDTQLVYVDGQLVGMEHQWGQLCLTLQSRAKANALMTSIIAQPGDLDRTLDLGTTLRITGVLAVRTNHELATLSGVLLANSAADLVVVAPAPWSRKRLLTVIGLLATLGIFLGFHIAMRIRQLKRQGRVEAALRASQRQLHDILETTGNVVFVVDLGGRFVLVNREWEKAAGQERSRVIGKPLRQTVAPDQVRKCELVIRQALQTDSPLTLEDFPIPGPPLRSFLTVLFALRDENGSAYGVCGVATDLTEHKRVRQALLDTEKLVATGRMAAAVAHEINNPLSGIRNAFEVLKPYVPASSQDARFIAMIEREIDRIGRIVRHMYCLYRPQAGQSEPVSFPALLKDAADLMARLAGARSVQLSVGAGAEPIEGLQPPEHLMQILLNLVRNAIEASPPGGTVRLEAAVVGETVVISVADQGAGIPEDLRNRVFEPFFSTKPSSGTTGMGLGLAISRSLAESMGGSLSFESTPGQGTRFQLRVPRNHPVAVGDPTADPPPPVAPPPHSLHAEAH